MIHTIIRNELNEAAFTPIRGSVRTPTLKKVDILFRDYVGKNSLDKSIQFANDIIELATSWKNYWNKLINQKEN